MVFNFYDFINEEYNSQNDPISEINRYSKKLGIILMGAPGVGKSTFIKNFIQTKNPNAKSFSTDDVATLMKKSYKGREGFNKEPAEINILKLKHYIESGKVFIYDTTGLHTETVTDIAKFSKERGYDIIIIHMVSDLTTIKSSNRNRPRIADDPYVEMVYQKQFHNMIEYVDNLDPKKYYIVFNKMIDNHKSNKYKFYKFKNGHLFRRKVNKYVPIKSYVKNSLNQE